MKTNVRPSVLAAASVCILAASGIFLWQRGGDEPRAEKPTKGVSAMPLMPSPPQQTPRALVPPAVVQDHPASPPPLAGPPKRAKPPAQNPAARAALNLVGADPTAELVWMEAINNPALPKQERQDLIEDLNEDGLSNPKKPASSDLPLIKARLEIIDRLMPEAMDKTNADALAEARKDLVNMQAKLSR